MKNSLFQCALQTSLLVLILSRQVKPMDTIKKKATQLRQSISTIFSKPAQEQELVIGRKDFSSVQNVPLETTQQGSSSGSASIQPKSSENLVPKDYPGQLLLAGIRAHGGTLPSNEAMETFTPKHQELLRKLNQNEMTVDEFLRQAKFLSPLDTDAFGPYHVVEPLPEPSEPLRQLPMDRESQNTIESNKSLPSIPKSPDMFDKESATQVED